MVDKKEALKCLWQNSIKRTCWKHLQEFPGGVKISYMYIYGHIPKNFHGNTMLAGLCNLCGHYRYAYFARLKDFFSLSGS